MGFLTGAMGEAIAKSAATMYPNITKQIPTAVNLIGTIGQLSIAAAETFPDPKVQAVALAASTLIDTINAIQTAIGRGGDITDEELASLDQANEKLAVIVAANLATANDAG